MPRPTQVRGLSARTPLREAAPRLLEARLVDFQRYEAKVARRLDADPVHDLRVAARRLRAALKVFGKAALRAQDQRLKRLQDALGAVRDLHLQLEWLERRRGSGRIASERRRALRATEKKLRGALATFARSSMPLLVGSLRAVRGEGRLGGSRSRRRLRRRLDDVERALKAALSLEPGPVHELRIAVKKLRYEAELVEPAFGKSIARLLRDLALLQTALGDLHDADVRVSLLRQRRAAKLLRDAEEERADLSRKLESELRRSQGALKKLRLL